MLLLAHGTPDVLGEMAEYLSKVTGGRALPQEVVEELQHRYAQIGLRETPGVEAPPLTKWTMTQGHLLEQALGGEKVYVGMRNWHPYIADVVAQMRTDGVTHIKAVCLAPQNSRTSVGLYRRAVLAAATGIEVEFVAGWAESPLLAEAFAEKLRPVWAEACAESGRRVPVLFTAHSVPCRTIMTGEASVAGARPGTPVQSSPDPYPVEAKRTAQMVAERMAAVGFRREGLVLCVSEPGHQRWAVDWADGRGDAEGDQGRRACGRGDAAGGLPLRSRRDSVRHRYCVSARRRASWG